jgi:hypothetical protein
LRTHPFADTPQYEQQYGAYPTMTGNGLGPCEPLDAPDELGFDTDSETGLPHGWSVYPNEALLSGYDRPDNVVENEDEIHVLFSDGAQHLIACGYCTASFRPRGSRSAVAWFHSHDCNADEVLADMPVLLAA